MLQLIMNVYLLEYNYLSRKRLAHITGSTPNPGHFAVGKEVAEICGKNSFQQR
jgi:hypothetical protein